MISKSRFINQLKNALFRDYVHKIRELNNLSYEEALEYMAKDLSVDMPDLVEVYDVESIPSYFYKTIRVLDEDKIIEELESNQITGINLIRRK